MDAFTSTIMHLTIGEIVGWGAGIIATVSFIIEFNKKIKFNPITCMLNWIGSRTNKGINDKMDVLEAQVKEIHDRQKLLEQVADEREAICYRVRILRFGDELRRGVKHSEESFNQVISDLDRYEKYCDDHPGFKNNKAKMAKKRIEEAYHKCLADNDFL